MHVAAAVLTLTLAIGITYADYYEGARPVFAGGYVFQHDYPGRYGLRHNRREQPQYKSLLNKFYSLDFGPGIPNYFDSSSPMYIRQTFDDEKRVMPHFESELARYGGNYQINDHPQITDYFHPEPLMDMKDILPYESYGYGGLRVNNYDPRAMPRFHHAQNARSEPISYAPRVHTNRDYVFPGYAKQESHRYLPGYSPRSTSSYVFPTRHRRLVDPNNQYSTANLHTPVETELKPSSNIQYVQATSPKVEVSVNSNENPSSQPIPYANSLPISNAVHSQREPLGAVPIYHPGPSTIYTQYPRGQVAHEAPRVAPDNSGNTDNEIAQNETPVPTTEDNENAQDTEESASETAFIMTPTMKNKLKHFLRKMIENQQTNESTPVERPETENPESAPASDAAQTLKKCPTREYFSCPDTEQCADSGCKERYVNGVRNFAHRDKHCYWQCYDHGGRGIAYACAEGQVWDAATGLCVISE